MLKSLHVENLTVFTNADFTFGKNLNVIIGENGTGKSHVLKAAYTPIAVSAARPQEGGGRLNFTKATLQLVLAQKLQAVFRPDGLWRLVHRKAGRGKCVLNYEFDRSTLNLKFSFSTVARTEVSVQNLPTRLIEPRQQNLWVNSLGSGSFPKL